MAIYSTKTNKEKNRKNKLKLGWSLICIFSLLLIIVAFNFFNIFSIIVLGFMGLLFYPICLFFIVIGIMLVLDKSIRVSKSIIVLSIFWLVLFVLIFQMVTSKGIDDGCASYLITTFKHNLTAGGVLFGIILYPIYHLTHTVAVYVILVSLLIFITSFLIDRIRNQIILTKVVDGNGEETLFKSIEEEQEDYEEDDEIDEDVVESEDNSSDIDDDIFIEDDDEVNEIRNEAKNILGLNKERTIRDLDAIIESSENKNEINSDNVTLDTLSNNNGKPNIIVHDDGMDFNVNKFVFNNKTSDKIETKSDEEIKNESRKQAALEYLNISKGKFQSKEQPKGFDNVNKEKPIETIQNVIPTSMNIQNQSYSQDNSNSNHNDLSSKLNNLTSMVQNNKQNDLYDSNLTKKSFEKDFNNNSHSITLPDHLKSQSNYTPKKTKEVYNGEVNKNIVEPNKFNPVQITIEDPMINKAHKKVKQPKPYIKPPIDLLRKYEKKIDNNQEYLQINAQNIVNTLKNFKIDTNVINIIQGPTFTLYEMQMAPGISVNTINTKRQDLEMALKSKIRLQIPIPGKNAFGIEVPNIKRDIVGLRDIIESEAFQSSPSPLTIALGKNISNDCKVSQIDKMVHTLVAGGTNSGKSVCLHTILVSLLYKTSPDELKLLLVDPKKVEFPYYNNLPHMLIPKAITECDKAIMALDWLVEEMDRRYQKLQSLCVRNIIAYNKTAEVKSGAVPKMYYIVMIFDEVGDYMLIAKKEIEEKVQRLAAMARACGIHLILTTQRPTTDVITGTIKTNLPSRIAFAVTSFIDSKTILETSGAESLLGRGDMLFLPQGSAEPERMQCAFVEEDDLPAILNFIRDNNEAEFDEEIADKMFNKKEGFDPTNGVDEVFDPLLKDALKYFIKTKKCSSSSIQGYFSIGYPRANKIVLQMEKAGFISPADSGSKRNIYISPQEFEEKFGESIDE